MKRKFLSTFLVAIVLLCSILLSSCGVRTPVPHPAYLSIPFLQHVFELDENYIIKVRCGHREFYGEGEETEDERSVAVLKCTNRAEDGTLLEEVLLEIKGFNTKEYYYENCKAVSVEIPKSLFVTDKGGIGFLMTMYQGEDEISNAVETLYYEKKDGKMYFSLEEHYFD